MPRDRPEIRVADPRSILVRGELTVSGKRRFDRSERDRVDIGVHPAEEREDFVPHDVGAELLDGIAWDDAFGPIVQCSVLKADFIDLALSPELHVPIGMHLCPCGTVSRKVMRHRRSDPHLMHDLRNQLFCHVSPHLCRSARDRRSRALHRSDGISLAH